jgi:metal-dependent amidase/aminoacylase/carboxypeptidase family protein
MFRLEFEGKASHSYVLISLDLTSSGYPELGVSAIEHLISCLNSLVKIDWPSSSEFGKTTFNIGTISGGAAGNIVPGHQSILPC